ncbi:MAG TPA: CBS domain-containing protein [Candidatus Binataceae bacterium]|nr:CBS domain-containing protein [Candidatus Binataceae bacterium]
MELTVKDVMTLKVKTLRLTEQLSLADDVMNLERIRHLPVLDREGDKLIGIVSQRDLFRGALAQVVGYNQRARRKLLDKLQLKDVMATTVVTTTPNTPLVEAARILIERKIGCLPVVVDGRLAGILTEADFVALYVNSAEAQSERVSHGHPE